VRAWIIGVGLLLWSVSLMATAETVKVTLPAALSFAVTNVGVATVASPSPTTISYSQLTVNTGHALRISVKADADFTPPSGPAIPASLVSWTTSAAINGVGTNGTLSAVAYGQVFETTLTKKAGNVDVAWTLAAPGSGVRAGNHVLTMRWKLEAITP
jgi:hypothetical protein